MILRIVLGRLLAGRDAAALADLRDQMTAMARPIRGLESLLVGARRGSADDTADDPPIEAAIASVWADAEAMVAATAVDEQGRFLSGRLALPFEIERADHYELVERTFAALPPASIALLRVLRVRARRHDEARLVELLRRQQPRLVELGLVASHVGRRVTSDGGVEAVTVSVWPDRATIRAASGGRPDRPVFADELAEWIDAIDVDAFEGIEVAPRLPAASGPPLLILDEDLRIVDLTATAAAMLGLPTADLVGHRAGDLFRGADGAATAEAWPTLFADGTLEGEATWDVPDVGSVLVRYLARRDAPIAGRHTVVVHRWHDPAPTPTDLDDALREAFPLV